MSSRLLSQRATSLVVTRLASQPALQCQQIATFTYRAPKTIRSSSTSSTPSAPLFLSSLSSSAASPFPHQLLRRSFFWSKKVDPVAAQPEILSGSKTTVTKETAIPNTDHSAEQTAAAEAALLKTKSGRLGFGSFSDIANRIFTSLPHIRTYAVWIAVGCGILFVFKAGLNIVAYFAELNFLDVGEVAFIAGLLTGVGLIGCTWAGTRFLRLRPEPIFQHALKRINADSVVHQYMGTKIESSNFRAYSFVNDVPRVTQEQRDRAFAAGQTGLGKYWQPKKLQLFFQVTGTNGAVGMASAEVEKTWKGDFNYNLLSVDLTSGERIVLDGDPSYQIYKGVIKLR